MKTIVGKRDLLLISNPLGIIMQGIGLVTLVPILVALIYDESNFIFFLGFGLFSVAVDYILRKLPFQDRKLRLKHGVNITKKPVLMFLSSKFR